jgi:hypothetical protein
MCLWALLYKFSWNSPPIQISGRVDAVGYCIYNGLVLLGRVQYIQLSHVCLSLMSLRFRWLLKTLSVLNHDINQIAGKFIEAGGSMNLWTVSGKRKNCLEGKPVPVPVYKKGDKTNCNNYRGISLFINCIQNFTQQPSVKVNSKLTPHVKKLIGDHKRRFWHTSSHNLHLSHTWGKKAENTMGSALFIDFQGR